MVRAWVLLQMSVRKRYEAMRDALNATGKPILFSMCEWGVSSPWEYGHQVCLRPHSQTFLAEHGRAECDWKALSVSDARVGHVNLPRNMMMMCVMHSQRLAIAQHEKWLPLILICRQAPGHYPEVLHF